VRPPHEQCRADDFGDGQAFLTQASES